MAVAKSVERGGKLSEPVEARGGTVQLMKTSGVFTLQRKAAESLVGAASSGVDEAGQGYVKLRVLPGTGVFTLVSDRSFQVHRNLAIELIAILRILVACHGHLGGAPPMRSSLRGSAHVPIARSVGPTRQGLLECCFDDLDGVRMATEADGSWMIVLDLGVAQDLCDALTEELARIAAWAPI